MSGKILIVDELATNRIVLKVKLSATPYEVLQAATAQAALEIAARERPDLILSSSTVSGVDLRDFITALRCLDGVRNTPIMLLQTTTCREERHAALRSGADDILSRPVSEPLLLARLRNLLRQHHTDHELTSQADDAARNAGFADPQADFVPPARIAIIDASPADALALRGRMIRQSSHCFTALSLDTPTPADRTDLYLIRIDMAQAEDGLRLLADLKAAQRTRGCPVIALLGAEAGSLAVTLLDIGADDVITGPIDHTELGLRIDNHLRRKRHRDGVRAHLLSGLQAAIVDPLTGVYNRRHALPYLDRQIAESRRSGTPLAVMLADLDFFKTVNDTYGHVAGDAVLCAVTQTLRAQLRDADMLARIGGEEFLIVLPDIARGRALRIAEQLCHVVRQTPVSLPGARETIGVTISIGVTVARHRHGLPGSGVTGLLDEADRALYLAKAQGRNQASFCTRSAA